jgi:hypothetical protein
MYAAVVAAPTAHSASTCERGTQRRHRRPESVLAPFWVFAAVLALLVVAAALPVASGRANGATDTRRVRVTASDTLWSIAAANPVAGLSTAESVAVMRRLNGLEARVSLQPGAVITVPCTAVSGSGMAMR